MRSYIVGTAGHIDHGKTALIKALTGIDTDRLKEEKRRGITIELGFAHLVRDDVTFGIVDVPGHERFIKSMVAGAGGIDLAILVIAADEGVMPQTREHLDICQLLGVRRGLVALTKVDLVDREWLSLVEDDLRGALAGTFLADSPLIRCSAITGDGIDQVGSALLQLAEGLPQRDPDGLMRLPLDRVFSIRGFGTVVTGPLISGRVRRGDEVEVLPSDLTTSVRRLQVHGEEVDEAVAGQRTAVNLAGVDRQSVARGEVMAHAGTIAPSAMIDVELRLLSGTSKGLKTRSKVLFHLGTRQQEATCVLLAPRQIGPGDRALAQLRFDRAVVALPGDRFILRGFVKQHNHGTTIGGGEVIRVLSTKLLPRNRGGIELLTRIAQARTDLPARTELEILAAGPGGIRRAALQKRVPLPPARLARLLEQLTEQRRILLWDPPSAAVVHQTHAVDLSRGVLEIVDRFHRENPLRPGIGRAELLTRLPRGIDGRLLLVLLGQLQDDGSLVVDQEFVLRPDHRDRVDAQLGPLAERIAARYREAALGPPREAEIQGSFDAPAATVRAAIKSLITSGKLVRVEPLLFHREPLDDLEQRLRAFLEERDAITPGEFKELVGQSRKFTIPLAEHFDARGVTRREGDVRRLARQ